MTSAVLPKTYMGISVIRLAHIVTLSRIVLAPAMIAMILHRNPWWPTFALGWVLGLSDKLDGMLARQAEPTKLGAFLDTLADKVIVLAVGFTLVHVGAFSIIPMIIIAVREFGLMAYRSYWAKRGLAVPARKSGKYKAFFQNIALGIAVCPPLAQYPRLDDIAIWLVAAFTVFTGIQYVVDGRTALSTTGERV